jgi:hypothetical protein
LSATLSYGPPRHAGTITSPSLAEVSGLAAASVVPGAWWVLNDSGNPPDLSLVDARGRLLATVKVRGASNRDWEDLGAARQTDGRRYLYVADIGDNQGERDDLVIYRVPEPARDARVTAKTAAFPFRYPDGRHNAEAIFVDPANGRMYVVTKSDPTSTQPGAVYRFPLPLRNGREVTLERVGGSIADQVARLPRVTGAAVSPDGTRLAIRTYSEAFEWRRRTGTTFERLFTTRPEHIRLARERQGEAIAYAANGRSLVTTSEKLPAPLWRLNIGR